MVKIVFAELFLNSYVVSVVRFGASGMSSGSVARLVQMEEELGFECVLVVTLGSEAVMMVCLPKMLLATSE